MDLPYTGEFIVSPTGIACEVINAKKVDFSQSVFGVQKEKYLVLRANGGEKIETLNYNNVLEKTYIANSGDVIFYYSKNEVYIPKNKKNIPWKYEEIEKYGYEKNSQEFDFKGFRAIYVVKEKNANLLISCIKNPTCLKNAFGTGLHQFLYQDATLKKDTVTGAILGISKYEFLKSWNVLEHNPIKEIPLEK